jgi:phosphatidylglycerophosphate synthase
MNVLSALYREFFLEQEDSVVQKRIATVPNGITAFGIALTILYVLQFVYVLWTISIPITVMLIGMSDLLDGYATRRLNQHSHLGKLLDALRDKLLRGAIILNCLFFLGFENALMPPIIAMCLAEIIMLYWDTEHYIARTSAPWSVISRAMQIPSLVAVFLIVVQIYWFGIYIPLLILIWCIALSSGVSYVCYAHHKIVDRF